MVVGGREGREGAPLRHYAMEISLDRWLSISSVVNALGGGILFYFTYVLYPRLPTLLLMLMFLPPSCHGFPTNQSSLACIFRTLLGMNVLQTSTVQQRACETNCVEIFLNVLEDDFGFLQFLFGGGSFWADGATGWPLFY